MRNAACFLSQICVYTQKKNMPVRIKASLLMKLFILQNPVLHYVRFLVAVWTSGQKVSKDAVLVASEKEQHCSHPMEIYIVRRDSMTDWINADRVPKVKDRGILEVISQPAFVLLLPQTHQHRDRQWDVSGQTNTKRRFWVTVSTSLLPLKSAYSLLCSRWVADLQHNQIQDNNMSAHSYKITEYSLH